MKRLVAYSSVSHFGFIALGIFAFTTQGGSGATLYMVNHGFSTGALFLVVGFLVDPARLPVGQMTSAASPVSRRGWAR